MKKIIPAVIVALVGLGVAAYAQGPGYGPEWRGGGWGPGMMGPGYGWGQGMGPGMMWGYPGSVNPDYAPPEAISMDQAKQIAKQYTDKYFPGFTVERVLPFTGMRRTMYGVELKGAKGEIRYLHINPWGGVMPFAAGAPIAAQ